MRRIVFTVTNDLTYDRRMQRICVSLQVAGFDVLLIGRKLKSSKPLNQHPFAQHRIKCLINTGPLFYAEYNLRLFFYLLFHRTDIVGACDLDTLLAVVLAGKLMRRRIVFDAHEHFTEVPEVERRAFVKRTWHAIGLWCIPKVHLRYTVGESLARILEEAYSAPFRVVRNVPIATAHSIIPLDQRQRMFVYIGALNEGRGLEHVIQAMQLLPDYSLKLIGEGDLSQKLRDLAYEYAVADRVEFTGLKEPEEIYQEISTAMIGLNLLEERSLSYYYSLANKFFDYIHAGVPSLNMNFPEYRSMIETNPVGICIGTLTPTDIANTIKEMLSDKEKMQAMIASSEAARVNFTWERESSILIEAISDL
jgi:glycosyltransferase involved in cell wall biosynthesis